MKSVRPRGLLLILLICLTLFSTIVISNFRQMTSNPDTQAAYCTFFSLRHMQADRAEGEKRLQGLRHRQQQRYRQHQQRRQKQLLSLHTQWKTLFNQQYKNTSKRKRMLSNVNQEFQRQVKSLQSKTRRLTHKIVERMLLTRTMHTCRRQLSRATRRRARNQGSPIRGDQKHQQVQSLGQMPQQAKARHNNSPSISKKTNYAPTKTPWTSLEQRSKRIGAWSIVTVKTQGKNKPPKEFRLLVIRGHTLRTEFTGTCAPLKLVNVWIKDTRPFPMRRFIDSRHGQDMDAIVKESFDITRKALSEICPQLKVMRIHLETGIYRDANGIAETYRYDGTMSAKSGWKIKDGHKSTQEEKGLTVKISFRDIASVIGIRYEGKCEENPIVPLGPKFANRSEAQFHKPATIFHYESNAKAVIRKYLRQCQIAKTIRFKLSVNPKDHGCKDPSDCYLRTSAKSDWAVDTSAYKIKKVDYGPIRTAQDMTRYLAKRDFKTLRRYSDYFGSYFENFIVAYSTYCRSYIKDPVGVKITFVETKTDQFGKVSRKRGRPQIVTVSRRYKQKFSNFVARNQTYRLNRIMSITLKSRKRGSKPGMGAYNAIRVITSEKQEVIQVVKGNCQSSLVQKAYQNMLKFANSY